jgi:hypothetical protein
MPSKNDKETIERAVRMYVERRAVNRPRFCAASMWVPSPGGMAFRC